MEKLLRDKEEMVERLRSFQNLSKQLLEAYLDENDEEEALKMLEQIKKLKPRIKRLEIGIKDLTNLIWELS